MKRIIATLLLVLLVIVVFPLQAIAAVDAADTLTLSGYRHIVITSNLMTFYSYSTLP